MRIKAECLSDDPGEYSGKGGLVKYQQLALLDKTEPVEARMLNSFDYRLNGDEKERFAGKCIGKVVVVDAKDWEFFNGRLKVKTGKIVEVQGLNGNGK